jgi:hypothetical protein
LESLDQFISLVGPWKGEPCSSLTQGILESWGEAHVTQQSVEHKRITRLFFFTL